MYDSKNNYIDEAKRLVKIIKENELEGKDISFFTSMKAKVKYNSFVSQKEIFWLRDIRDKQD